MSQGHTVLSANSLSAEPRLASPTMVNIVSERSSCVICGIVCKLRHLLLGLDSHIIRFRDILFLFHLPGVGQLVVPKVVKRSVIWHSENALNISKSHLCK